MAALKLRSLALSLMCAAVWVSPAAAHTTLLSASPAPNAIIANAPFVVRLVFSEPIDASLVEITILDAHGHAQHIAVRSDPHDVHAVLGDVTPLDEGAYRLVWHAVSADGHPVQSNYVYYVGSHAGPAPPLDESASIPALPFVPSVLRALAAFTVLGAAGALTFVVWLLPGADADATRRYGERMRGPIAWLACGAVVMCCAHALAWAAYATSHAGFHAERALLLSGAGHVEVARIVLCALTVWSLLLVRNPQWAAVTAAGAILATAAIGHAAAIDPVLLIPLKAVHLGAAAIWLGGLVLLVAGRDMDAALYASLAQRVSAVALAALLLVAFTGIVQTLVVVKPAQILTSRYGLLSLGKVVAILVLVALGATNRLRHVPAVLRGDDARALRRTVAWEIAVFVAAFLLAGALAYTAPPEHVHHDMGSHHV